MSSYYEKMLATGEVKCIDEEIPFEIPQGWEWCRMRDVIQLLSGRDLEPSMYNSSQKGIPYITGASNFNNENLIVNRWTQTPVTVSEEGDLLITCKGTIGTMAFNNIGSIHIARQIMAIHSKDVDLHYLKLYFELNIGTLESQANSMIPGISREVVLNSLVPIPPLQEQIKIVEKSNSLMPLVSKYSFAQGKLNLLNNVIKNKLEKTILQEAIKGKLVPQIAEEGTAKELLEQIKAEKQKLVKEGKLKKSALNDSIIFKGDDNKYWEKSGDNIVCIDEEIPFGIPSSWSWCRLGNIASVKGGKRIPVGEKLTTENTGHMYIRVADMKENTVKTDDIHYISESIYQKIKSYTISTEDLYITVAGTIGNVGEIPKVFDNANLTENADKIVFKGICKKFLMYCLLSNFVQSQIKKCTTKVGQPKLAIVRIEDLVIPLPPIKEQYRIVHKIEQTASIMSK